jgi:hypothetical protein
MISSIRSCNQNTGPVTDTKRLKFNLVVMTSLENGSLEDNNVKEWSFLRELRKPVIMMILVAGRMSLLTWPDVQSFFPLHVIVSDIPRRRIAPTGIST